MKEELNLYIKENYEKKPNILKEIFTFPFRIKSIFFEDDEDSLEEYLVLNQKQSDFQTTLFQLIDERHLTDAQVYNKVHIDRRLFSKIRSNKDYHPSKETILLLGFSLELSIQELLTLLESASYSLPKNNKYDLIIRFCFINHIYSLKEVNSLLEEYHCKLFRY